MPESEDRPIATLLPFPRRALAPRYRGPHWLAGYEAQHPGSIARLYQVYGGVGPIAVDRAVWKVLAPIAYRQGVTLTVVARDPPAWTGGIPGASSGPSGRPSWRWTGPWPGMMPNGRRSPC
jgi:hypothetical protein